MCSRTRTGADLNIIDRYFEDTVPEFLDISDIANIVHVLVELEQVLELEEL